MPNKKHGCYKSVFNNEWCDPNLHPDWSSWIAEVQNDRFSAYCKLCRRSFSLSNMGAQAVRSHHRGPSHLKKISNTDKCLKVNELFLPKNKEKIPDCEMPDVGLSLEALNKPITVTSVSSDKPYSSASFFGSATVEEQNQITAAEIMWALRVVHANESFNSCKNDNDIFKKMFFDSKIAKKFAMGPDKCRYVLYYGIAPYFSNTLRSFLINSVNHVVICFDEALNKVIQRSQMDLHVRYYSDQRDEVCTRYLNSVFMDKSTADDLVIKFKEGTQCLPPVKILQISMDGPAVNWSFLTKFKTEIESAVPSHPKLIDIGSCSLHVVHGAIQAGHKSAKWNVHNFLRGLYYLFKDSPARRGNFSSLTDTHEFPLKFCQVRWLENSACCDRALLIFDSVKEYIEKTSLGDTISAKNVITGITDPLMKPKLAFFKNVSADFEPFLTEFQSQKPLAPFLYDVLFQILKRLLKRFINRKTVDECSNARKLLKINLDKNLLSPSNINIGVRAANLLKDKKINERMVLEFRKDCQTFLKKTAEKLMNRCSLQYEFTRAISFVDPRVIANNKSVACSRAKSCIATLFNSNQISESVAELSLNQYNELLYDTNGVNKDFENFDKSKTSLDKFWSHLLKDKNCFKDLWIVIKLILIISHGNAAVESGFSVNKNMLVENLREDSLVKLRQVHDGLHFNGGILGVDVHNKELINSVKLSRSRYEMAKKEALSYKSEKEKQTQLKRKLLKEINDLKNKKLMLETSRCMEIEEIDNKITKLTQNFL